jgi:hypothetical protein
MPKDIDAQILCNIFNEWKIGIDNKDYDLGAILEQKNIDVQTAEEYKESEVSIPIESLRKLVVVFSARLIKYKDWR